MQRTVDNIFSASPKAEYIALMFRIEEEKLMKKYPVIDLKATGARIKELRHKHNLRVEDIARFMGFESEQAVYKWQRGDSLPTVDNLLALSRLFETPIENILCECKGGDDRSPLPFLNFLLM